ncbi:uncharacterized protein LOC110263719 [Arachis ipaensis]|uniref:uncharacterized protein LOC110263719 n=1 Tax=Arachis ipaensis TaxID=130454 RepID=UPI000A2B65A6|nr:uncharacterized protein LOC110263719 [Arachis ipaensis]
MGERGSRRGTTSCAGRRGIASERKAKTEHRWERGRRGLEELHPVAAVTGVLRTPGPLPEFLVTSTVAGKVCYYGHFLLVSVVVIGICRRYRLRWLPGCRRASSKTAALSIQPFLLQFELLRLLRKWLGTEVLVVGILIVDFGSRRKGLCETFGLWICILRIWVQKSRRVYLVVVEMLCIAIDYLLYPRLYLDIFYKRVRDCIG